jgi:hypothetical protein
MKKGVDGVDAKGPKTFGFCDEVEISLGKGT